MKGFPIAVFGTRAAKYGYSNARVKAMKASLIPNAVIQQMVEAGGISEIISILERTDYKQDLSEPALKYSGAELIEFALGRHLVRKARKVLSFTPSEALPAVLSVLEKWDVYNLKTILLARHLGHSNEETEPFIVPAGAFTEEELKRILERDSVEEVVASLSGTGYGAGLKQLLDGYKKTRNVQPLLNAIERHFYSKLVKSIPIGSPDAPKIIALIKAEIDNKNVMNILRGKREGASEQEIMSYLIEGGTLSGFMLERLARARGADDAVKEVCKLYRLDAAAEAYAETHSIVWIEIALERKVMELGLRTLRTSVLSPGTIVGYLYLKENEIMNIRKIVRGKEFGTPPEKIRETIVLI